MFKCLKKLIKRSNIHLYNLLEPFDRAHEILKKSKTCYSYSIDTTKEQITHLIDTNPSFIHKGCLQYGVDNNFILPFLRWSKEDGFYFIIHGFYFRISSYDNYYRIDDDKKIPLSRTKSLSPVYLPYLELSLKLLPEIIKKAEKDLKSSLNIRCCCEY